MKTIFALVLLICSFNYSQELRGTWLARNSLTSKEALAQAMDSLAKNNFNVVYVNAWSRGYPLWNSDVFFQETGIKIDPEFVNRDVLAEAVAEGHRLGLHVEAWFEYGFVGGWTGNQPPGVKGPIFQTHPNWVARKVDGTEIDASNFYWMIHTHRDVQNFLIALAAEVTRNYDIDGIELDRIRYSSLEYGYDYYTDSLYRSEHNGNPPPINYQDSGWLRWRADKLNEFAQRIRDSIKIANPFVNVSNAPSLYSSNSYTSYQSFAQDWVSWVNNGFVDNIQVQSYVTTNSFWSSILDYIPTLVNNINKVYPSFAVKPGSTTFTNSDVSQFINTSRSKGYKGNSIWYYVDLIPYLPHLKANQFSVKAYPPFSSPDWREYYKVIVISDLTNAVRTGVWQTSTLTGYSGASIFANPGAFASVEYFIDVPVSGIYEVYAFTVVGSNRTDSAEYSIYDSLGFNGTKYIDQSNAFNKRWFKLGDYALKQGRSLVVKLTNNKVQPNNVVSADAVMISLNRRLSPNVTVSINDFKQDSNTNPKIFNLKNHPNPFNGQSTLSYNLNDLSPFRISIFNIVGEKVFEINSQPDKIGTNTIELDLSSSQFSSGIYLLNITQGEKSESIKIILSK